MEVLQALVLAKLNEGCVDAKVTISGTSGDTGMFLNLSEKCVPALTNSRRVKTYKSLTLLKKLQNNNQNN